MRTAVEFGERQQRQVTGHLGNARWPLHFSGKEVKN